MAVLIVGIGLWQDRAPVGAGPGRDRRPPAGVRQVGIPASAPAAEAPDPAPADPPAPAAAPGPRPRDRLRDLVAVERPGDPAQRPADAPAGVTWSAASTFSVLVGFAHYRLRIRIPLDEHVVVLAPPRTGKSGWLARVIMHYPGPVVSTTTKADVFSLTSGIRERRGPVHVFNPQRIGGVPSTFRWNPLEGCQEPGDRHPPGRRVRAGGQPEGRGGRRVVRAEGRGLPAGPVLRGRAGRPGHARGRPMGAGRPASTTAQDILWTTGGSSGRWSSASWAGRRARPPRPSR